MHFILLTTLLSSPASDANQAITAFARAADAQDVAALTSVLHDDFRVSFVVRGTESASQLSKEQYLGMAKAKKLGGDRRAVKVVSLDVQGPLAFARVRLTGKKASFESMMTLLKSEGRWRVLSDSVLFAPKG